MQYDRSAAAVTGVRTQPERPRLLDEVRRRLRMKHYSLRTEQAYLYWIRRYIQANGRRHPREMGGAEVERFLSDLARKGRVAPSTQNQALSALPFLYREALELKLPWMDEVVRGKRPQRLPTLLSQAEVRAAKALFRPSLPLPTVSKMVACGDGELAPGGGGQPRQAPARPKRSWWPSLPAIPNQCRR
jgi:hypothetical protein